MELQEYLTESFNTAEEKGWHSIDRSFGDLISLCHAELSEALEEYRDGKHPCTIYYKDSKPEGVPIELADLCIRVFDMCKFYGIDLEYALQKKMKYNKTRSFRHGDKQI